MVNNQEDKDAARVNPFSGITINSDIHSVHEDYTLQFTKTPGSEVQVAESGGLIWCNEKNRQCTKDCSHYKRCHPITPEAPASTTSLHLHTDQ